MSIDKILQSNVQTKALLKKRNLESESETKI